MKKYLIILFIAFVSFFSIDKVFAVSITSYDEYPYWIQYQTVNYTTIDNNINRTLNFAGINYRMTDITRSGANNYPRNITFVYRLAPNSDTNSNYNMVFALYVPASRGVQVYSNNDSCLTSASALYSNTQDASTDRRFGPVYNVECPNRTTSNPINITITPEWHLDKIQTGGVFSLGISRIYFSDSLTTMNSQFNELKSLISRSDSGIVDAIDETNSKLQETNDTLNDDDTSESSDTASSFFSGFSTDTHGLTGIITAPITLIGNITSSTCTPLQVPLPFVDENLTLPCMSSIYSQYFGDFYNIYKVITFGIIAYWVCVRIFNLVKDFKNPEHDEIEVMDL